MSAVVSSGAEPNGAPAIDKGAFCCPWCRVLTTHRWFRLSYLAPTPDGNRSQQSEAKVSLCDYCHKGAYWLNYGGEESNAWRLVLPFASVGAPPHEDMPPDVRVDYEEARSIAALSPRGACAILRLALQRLLSHLGCSGQSINSDIAALVADGLPVKVQQTLDAVRVVGNNAVHPGELDLRDDQDTAAALFEALNFIVQDTIARPNAVQALYDALPEGARDSINRRDLRP